MAYFSPYRWFSQCIIQQSGQELVNGLTTCLHSQCLVEAGGLESILVEILLPHLGHLAMSEDTFGCHNGDRGAIGI